MDIELRDANPGAGRDAGLARDRIAGWVRRHPIAAFLAWFTVVGQGLAFAPLYLDTDVPDQWFIISSTLLGLLLPALAITWMIEGVAGLRTILGRITAVRAPVVLYLIGVVLMPVVAVMLAVGLLGSPPVATSVMASALGSALLVGLVVNFVSNNLWEEVAWMGFVQHRLQQRHGAMKASLLTAPLFALQHLALILANDASMVAPLLVGFVLISIPFRAFIAWLYNRSGGSLFLVGLVHALGNAVAPGTGLAVGYLRVLYPDSTEVVGVLHILAFVVLGLIVMAATRLRLGSNVALAGALPTPIPADVEMTTRADVIEAVPSPGEPTNPSWSSTA